MEGGGVGTCDDGLLCLSNVCVRPPPADCQQVSEQLASIELGNYAPVETRRPVVAKYAAECEKARVSKEEGECLRKARSKWAAGRCVPRMFPEQASKAGDCQGVSDKIMEMLALDMANAPPEMQGMMSKIAQAMSESCAEDGWPDSFKNCILQSSGKGAMNECDKEMPKELRQRLEQRMSDIMR